MRYFMEQYPNSGKAEERERERERDVDISYSSSVQLTALHRSSMIGNVLQHVGSIEVGHVLNHGGSSLLCVKAFLTLYNAFLVCVRLWAYMRLFVLESSREIEPPHSMWPGTIATVLFRRVCLLSLLFYFELDRMNTARRIVRGRVRGLFPVLTLTCLPLSFFSFSPTQSRCAYSSPVACSLSSDAGESTPKFTQKKSHLLFSSKQILKIEDAHRRSVLRLT